MGVGAPDREECPSAVDNEEEAEEEDGVTPVAGRRGKADADADAERAVGEFNGIWEPYCVGVCSAVCG